MSLNPLLGERLFKIQKIRGKRKVFVSRNLLMLTGVAVVIITFLFSTVINFSSMRDDTIKVNLNDSECMLYNETKDNMLYHYYVCNQDGLIRVINMTTEDVP